MNGDNAKTAGLHPITPPATMRRGSTLVNRPSPDETDPNRPTRNLVLCFDGTGNQYKGDGTETNILKIFGLLDRNAPHQYHYYQPGIGTYAVRSSIGVIETDWFTRQRASLEKGIDLIFGTSLSDHVLAGYKFLMRYYAPGDNIYIFGFSRGAYTARFLAEMLDDVGLLPHGNEEMVQFAWEVFTQWQCRKGFDGKPGDDPSKEVWWTGEGRKARENRKNYEAAKGLGGKLKGFREHFSRRLDPIRFLGLFDTVNSVPQYENPFLGRARSKKAFPYSARSSAREIWHAVSIDERRVKFRPDLVYQSLPPNDRDPHRFAGGSAVERAAVARAHSHHVHNSPQSPMSPDEVERIIHDASQFGQKVHEVWFAGNHSDVGGGWADPEGGGLNMADVPLVWMVRAARRAGVLFNDEAFGKLKEGISRVDGGAVEEKVGSSGGEVKVAAVGGSATTKTAAGGDCCAGEKTLHERYISMLSQKHHDVLKLERAKYLWMEYLPFKRMDMNEKTGRWTPIRLPLSRGDTRDVPDESRVHGSVIQRMKANPDYKPRNAILGGGRGGVPLLFWKSRPPCHFNPDHWVPVLDDPDLSAIGDDEFGAVYRRLSRAEIEAAGKKEKEKGLTVNETEVVVQKNGVHVEEEQKVVNGS